MALVSLLHPGVLAALLAALLFGSSTPLLKALLSSVDPWMLAGLLYLGSGLGLGLFRCLRRSPPVRLSLREALWLMLAVIAGGGVAPVLLMYGLSAMPAANAALLLNAEGVFTALLAWFVFRENLDRRIAAGMIAIVSGALVLSWPHQQAVVTMGPSWAVLGACFAWGLDNNFTRKVALADATWIAAVKGLVAGTVNLLLAKKLGASLPDGWILAGTMTLGFLTYGVSLVLFVIGLRHLGSARTGAYFSLAPFFGALIALAMGEAFTLRLGAAGVLMGLGVWLHLTENHRHEHTHEALEHDHEHVHDEHHQHAHDFPVTPGTKHRHRHSHAPLTHTHRHYPDAHHQHKH